MLSVCTSFDGKLISIRFAKCLVEGYIVDPESINASHCSKHGVSRSKLLLYKY